MAVTLAQLFRAETPPLPARGTASPSRRPAPPILPPEA